MKRLEPGEAGEPTIVGQRLVDGVWETVSNARRATRWHARVYYRDLDGVRREAERTASTQARVKTRIDEAVNEGLKKDTRIKLSTPFGVVGQAWIDDLPRMTYSPRTKIEYAGVWAKHLKSSSLKLLPLSVANDPQRLRQIFEAIADEVGEPTAKKAKAVTSRILERAIKDGVLGMNAARQTGVIKAKVPKPAKYDHRRAFTREERDVVLAEADRLAEIAKAGNPRTYREARAAADLLAFMAGTGVRITEARSTESTTWDREARRIFVPGTKSGTAPRWLNVPVWLNRRLERRVQEFGETQLLFPSPSLSDGTREWDQSNCADIVRAVLDSAGLEWAVPHTFRRTVASFLDDQKVPVRRIADQLGITPEMVVKKYLGRDLSGDKGDLADHL